MKRKYVERALALFTALALLVPMGSVASAAESQAASCNVGSSTISQCFPDAGLAGAVASAVKKQTSSVFTSSDAAISSLNGDYKGIKSLEGIQNLKNLTSLSLYNNSISDVAPLASLTKLTDLGLGDNAIKDITPLGKLTTLQKINLSHNQVTEFKTLTSNKGLQRLWMAGNAITDYSPINNFPNLTGVDLSENQISDVSVINAKVSPKDYSVLTGQKITKNVTIDEGGTVSIPVPKGFKGENLEPLSISAVAQYDITKNSNYLLNGTYDAATGTVTWKNVLDGGSYSFSFNTQRDRDISISDDEPFSGGVYWNVTVKRPATVTGQQAASTASANAASARYSQSDVQHQAEVAAYVENVQQKTADESSAGTDVQQVAETRAATSPCVVAGKTYAQCLTDAKLAEAVAKAAGKTVNDKVTDEDLAKFEGVSAIGAGITSLEGIQNFPNIKKLLLENNDIADIAPLKSMDQLVYVDLYTNKVKDASPLADKANLEGIMLGDNQLTTIGTLGNLPKLTAIDLYGNQLTDISPLAKYGTLEAVWLSGNNITDISSLKNLKNLKRLQMEYNHITDISSMSAISPTGYSMNGMQTYGKGSSAENAETVNENGSWSVATPIDRNGQHMVPKNITPASGQYDAATGKVTWTAINTTGVYSFNFSSSADNDFLYSGSYQQYIKVNHSDQKAPTILGAWDTKVTVGQSFDPLAAVTAVDDVDGSLPVTVTRGSVNTAKAGTYLLQYAATDSSENTAYIRRQVVVTTATLTSVDKLHIDGDAVPVGTAAKLPDKATARWSDGSSTNEGVTWDAVPESVYTKPGNVTVTGKVRGKTVQLDFSVQGTEKDTVVYYSTANRKWDKYFLCYRVDGANAMQKAAVVPMTSAGDGWVKVTIPNANTGYKSNRYLVIQGVLKSDNVTDGNVWTDADAKGLTLKPTNTVMTVADGKVVVGAPQLASQQLDVAKYKQQNGKDLPEDQYKVPEAPAGETFAGWFEDASFTKPYTKTTGKAYPKFVDSGLSSASTTLRAQLAGDTTLSGSNALVRVLSPLDSKFYREAGYDFTVQLAGGKTTTVTSKSSRVYAKLKDGTEVKTAEDIYPGIGAKWFTAGFVAVPRAYFDSDIVVRNWWRTMDGTKVYTSYKTDKANGYVLNIQTLAAQVK